MFVRTLLSLLALVVAVSATNQKGLDYLAVTKKQPGVITLPSGLQYKVLKKGSGTSHPTIDSPCSCHYEGKLIDGQKFDSSYDRGEPTTFAPNQVIKGWTEAMPMMVEGDKWELYIPSELAYGDSGSPPKIGGGDALIFQMEIIEILGDKVPALSCDAKTKEECNEREVKYITKISDWDAAKIDSEFGRLTKMKSNAMKNELKEWVNRRTHILGQLSSKEADEAEEL